MITALKYTISDHPQPIDSHLHKYIAHFLAAISDPDLVGLGGRGSEGGACISNVLHERAESLTSMGYPKHVTDLYDAERLTNDHLW